MSRYLQSDLPPRSIVIERYVYTNRRGKDSGVQWLAQIVDEDGRLLLIRVCRTRKEALEAAGRSSLGVKAGEQAQGEKP